MADTTIPKGGGRRGRPRRLEGTTVAQDGFRWHLDGENAELYRYLYKGALPARHRRREMLALMRDGLKWRAGGPIPAERPPKGQAQRPEQPAETSPAPATAPERRPVRKPPPSLMDDFGA